MEFLINSLNDTLAFWLNTSLHIAFAMSALVNIIVYGSSALVIDFFTKKMSKKGRVGSYIDDRPLKKNQKSKEIKLGFVTCLIFASGSLVTRFLYDGIWPSSWVNLILQIVIFTIVYDTYSYFLHRFLHTKTFRKVHLVHHRAVRLTPWSSYSVHPVEAILITIFSPLFMLLFPFSLGVALALHIQGLVFTVILHSNFRFNGKGRFLQNLNNLMLYHRFHHSIGNTNYGFGNKIWDSIFKTKLKETVK